MPGASRATASCVATASLLVSCSGTSGGAPGDAWLLEHAVVQFSYSTVNPQTVRIATDGNVTWLNLSEDTRGFVVLPASMAPAFACKDLGPYFSKAAAGYRSRAITREESERVELPCRLARGTYDYEIWLQGTGVGSESDDDAPSHVLRAKIVVE